MKWDYPAVFFFIFSQESFEFSKVRESAIITHDMAQRDP